jgi:hypothetical protein
MHVRTGTLQLRQIYIADCWGAAGPVISLGQLHAMQLASWRPGN